MYISRNISNETFPPKKWFTRNLRDYTADLQGTWGHIGQVNTVCL